MTTNERYNGLNNRFEKRAAILRKLGFEYEIIEEYNIAVFVRRTFPKGIRTIPAAVLHHAGQAEWIDTLKSSVVTAS